MDDDSRATTAAPVPAWRMFVRLLAILATAGVHLLRTMPAALVLRIVAGRARSRRFRYRGLVRGLQALGPTFVKFGQISSTRRDALPADLCDAMGQLHDAVTPMSWRRAEPALRAAQQRQPLLVGARVDRTPVASGSIACVYRAELADGRLVALKLKRPGIDARMQADLALVRFLVRIGERLPKLRGMPMADLVGYLSRAILGQLDFARERENLARLRASLAGMPRVRVPELHPDASAESCLVFEYLPGLDRNTAQELPDEVRAALGALLLGAVHKMFFVEGLVHCDLHPGNVYLTRDAQLVVLDAGYCVQLPDRVRRLIGEFFARLAAGDGRRCGEIVLESAVNAGEHTDAEGFVTEMAELVATKAGPDHPLDMSEFGNGVYDLQQRYGIYAASDFAFPLMSLLVAEGTVRGFSGAVDFRQVGVGNGSGSPAGVVAVGQPVSR